MAEFVYVVTMTAVYDHGCCGVFVDLQAAEAHAQAMADDSDGHHDFRIDQIPMASPVWPSLASRWMFGDRSQTRSRDPEVSVRPFQEF